MRHLFLKPYFSNIWSLAGKNQATAKTCMMSRAKRDSLLTLAHWWEEQHQVGFSEPSCSPNASNLLTPECPHCFTHNSLFTSAYQTLHISYAGKITLWWNPLWVNYLKAASDLCMCVMRVTPQLWLRPSPCHPLLSLIRSQRLSRCSFASCLSTRTLESIDVRSATAFFSWVSDT